MYRHLQILIPIVLIFGVAATGAQTPTPTPGPNSPENLRGVPSIAPDYRSEERRFPDLGRVGVDITQQRILTLRDAIVFALENNKDIEVTRKNIRIAEFDLQAALGVYEPRFSGQTYFERSRTPVFSFFGGGPNFSLTQSNILGNAGLQGQLRRTGATYGLTFNNNRNTTNNIFTSVNPTFTSSLAFTFAQPLIRGRKFDQNRRTIEIANANLELTDTQFRQRIVEVVAGVQRAYWDLTFALRNLQVQRDGVRDAIGQLEHNRRLVEEGQLAPIDIIAAETQVANFEQAVFDALNSVNTAENAIKNLISPNRTDEIWAEALMPVDSVEVPTPRLNLTEAIESALQNRPEIEINNTQKNINAIDQKFYRNQKKPQIDIVASYSQTGAAGTLNTDVTNPFGGSGTTPALNQVISNLNQVTARDFPALPQITPIVIIPTPPLPDFLNGGFGSTLGNLFANRFPTYRVGVQFDLPFFGNKTAEAQFGRSRVEGERLETQRQQIEQTIQTEVRNALQAIRTAEGRLRAAAIARENTAKQYESEQRKLDAGQSDIYTVLERQTALTVARGNELRARTDLNKSIAELQRVTGNTLKANDIEPK